MGNIRPFREEPTWVNKTGVALVYVVLGWVVTTSPVREMGNLLSIFLLLGILTWAFIVRSRSAKYFVRYHVVQAVLLNISLTAALWLLIALLGLLNSLPGVNLITGYLEYGLFGLFDMGSLLHASLKDVFVMTIALVLGVYSLRGRYTELPWITDGVRHWV